MEAHRGGVLREVAQGLRSQHRVEHRLHTSTHTVISTDHDIRQTPMYRHFLISILLPKPHCFLQGFKSSIAK